MRVVSTLSDIGSNTPTLLNGVVTNEFSTAREAMLRMAVAQSPALEDPPPSLLHASVVPNAHVLYGGSLDPPFDDVEYTRGKTPEIKADDDLVYCVGSGMVDVCKSTARPAVLYAYRSSNGLVVRMVVYDCPLASMEVELFHGDTTSFERAWLGETCKAQRVLREKVHSWMISRGQDRFPSFLYDRNESYHTTRRGVLPFLRLRAPSDENETIKVNKMLEALEPPKAGFTTLKGLAGVTADSIADEQISLETVFSSFVPVSPTPSGPEEEVDYGSDEEPKYIGSSQASRVPCLGILSLCLLKQTTDEIETDAGLERQEQSAAFAPEDLERALQEEAMHTARIRGLKVDPEESTTTTSPLGFAAPLLRTSDSALIVSSSNPVAAATAVITAVASEEDAGLMAEHLGLLKPGTLLDALSHVVNACPRQCLLVCYPKSKVFITPSGSYKVTDDGARRLLLSPWVTPLMVRYEKISEIKVHGVFREQVQLSAEFKRQVILNRTVQVPESVVALMQDVSSRLATLEAAVKEAPVMSSSAGPSKVAPPPSGAAKSFKRVLDVIGAFEGSLAKRP